MRNPKLYLVESEVPRVNSYLALTKAREHRNQLYVNQLYVHTHVIMYFSLKLNSYTRLEFNYHFLLMRSLPTIPQ